MTCKEEYESRISLLRAGLDVYELDALLLVGQFPEKEGHVVYLTGHRLWAPQWPTSIRSRGAGFSFAILTKNALELFSVSIDASVLAASVTRAYSANDAIGAVACRINELSPSALGIAGLDIMPSSLLLMLFKYGVKWKDAEELLYKFRRIKSAAEREILEEGARLAVAAIDAGQAISRRHISNREIGGAIVGKALQIGAEHILRCRVRSGPETGLASWPYASERKINDGEAVQIDLVGIHKRYVFDISRVWAVGKGKGRTQAAIDAAWESTNKLAAQIVPGRTFSNAVRSWQSSLPELPGAKIELDGHSVGIDVVEPPWISMADDILIDPGMILCLEPSVALEDGQSFKIEQAIAVTSDRSVVLSQ